MCQLPLCSLAFHRDGNCVQTTQSSLSVGWISTKTPQALFLNFSHTARRWMDDTSSRRQKGLKRDNCLSWQTSIANLWPGMHITAFLAICAFWRKQELLGQVCLSSRCETFKRKIILAAFICTVNFSWLWLRYNHSCNLPTTGCGKYQCYCLLFARGLEPKKKWGHTHNKKIASPGLVVFF